jgi:hypothetical protein|nr:MAG TPA: hypothetical protein [Caudoviricetes sp.]
MKEQHISYETAKLCKELGIDLPHTHYYVYPFRNFKADGELKKNLVPDDYHDTMLQVVSTRKNQPQIAPAYTQSLLQKYLRDVHNIRVLIDFETIDDSETAYVWNVVYDIPEGKCRKKDTWDFYETISSFSMELMMWYKTYEEALEFGLQEGIKLIPMAK